jgi:hypothetical protein
MQAKAYGLIDTVITKKGAVVGVEHDEPETGTNS